MLPTQLQDHAHPIYMVLVNGLIMILTQDHADSPRLGKGLVVTTQAVFPYHTPHCLRQCSVFLYCSCISIFSSNYLKIPSLYNLCLVSYDPVLKVMSGQVGHHAQDTAVIQTL